MNTIIEYFDDNWDYIQTLLRDSKYPNTAKLLLRFYKKTSSISNAISKLDSLEDFYPCMLLVRSQIEHFIVINYVCYKYIEDKSDKIAAKYYEEYLLQELLKRTNYSLTSEIEPSTKLGKFFNEVLRKLKQSNVLNKSGFVENVNKVAKEFDIKSISKYVNQNQSLPKSIFIKPHRIKAFLEEYNYLSSFIHAGPSADLAIFENDNESLKVVVEENKVWNKGIISAVKFYILFFLAHENESLAEKLRTLIEIEMNK